MRFVYHQTTAEPGAAWNSTSSFPNVTKAELCTFEALVSPQGTYAGGGEVRHGAPQRCNLSLNPGTARARAHTRTHCADGGPRTQTAITTGEFDLNGAWSNRAHAACMACPCNGR